MRYRQHVSHGTPRQSQLTNGALRPVYAVIEATNDAVSGATTIDDIRMVVEECAAELESLRDEFQGNLENMPEGLQQGPTGELITERLEALDSFIEELQGIDWPEDPEEPSEDDEDAKKSLTEAAETALEDARAAANDILGGFSL